MGRSEPVQTPTAPIGCPGFWPGHQDADYPLLVARGGSCTLDCRALPVVALKITATAKRQQHGRVSIYSRSARLNSRTDNRMLMHRHGSSPRADGIPRYKGLGRSPPPEALPVDCGAAIECKFAADNTI